jgi:AraC-like DNA-binding protein
MNVNLHTLSAVINEGYNKNFFDFINDYRIEEFKRLAATEQYKHYTFLAIAMEVGFSSKTTFNRAFKKCTGQTPREYFSNVQETQLEDLSE